MNTAVIVDAVRTPIARASADKGTFRDIRSEDLSAEIVRALIARTGIDPGGIDDLRWGCVQQQGEQGFNLARIVALVADLPVSVAGVTVNRNCGSSMQAIHDAAAAIAAEYADIQVVGGVEHMDHIPMNKDYSPCPSLLRRHSEAMMNMGLTAEFVARKYRIARDRQDAFAYRSHRLAAEATRRGDFAREIVPIWGRDESGRKTSIRVDQCIREDTSPEALAALAPAFDPAGGSVTAGNSSPLNVGAAGLLMMAEATANRLGLAPLAKVRSVGVVGVDPEEMGIGPVPAIRKALARAGLALDDVEVIEINEAFAVQVLACCDLLSLDPQRVNRRGGSIAIGHPLGASGARIATTCLHRMRAEGARFGLAAMCIGQGQGIATLFEAIA
ncbi:MAG: acetyl-CoA C-acyltransferase [Isosphaeraceae bacterium]|nr:acetyl-CoA C-acyltransferase [Isosphaeraceae bacterium]